MSEGCSAPPDVEDMELKKPLLLWEDAKLLRSPLLIEGKIHASRNDLL